MEIKINYEVELVEPTDMDTLKEIEKMQAAAWGFTDREIVPANVSDIVAETGGQLLAARTRNKQIIGFALAFLAKNDTTQNHPGIPEDELFLASHMVAVLPQLQSSGVGYELKQAQKRDAVRRGIRWMQWTYYPMLTKNANLNFIKLRSVRSYKFVPNKYDVLTSGLYKDLPTDRLVVLWDMKSTETVQFPRNTVLLTKRDDNWRPILDEAKLENAAAGNGLSAVICSVPSDFVNLRNNDLAAARAWQENFARVAATLFSSKFNWSIANFRLSDDKREGEYLFIRE